MHMNDIFCWRICFYYVFFYIVFVILFFFFAHAHHLTLLKTIITTFRRLAVVFCFYKLFYFIFCYGMVVVFVLFVTCCNLMTIVFFFFHSFFFSLLPLAFMLAGAFFRHDTKVSVKEVINDIDLCVIREKVERGNTKSPPHVYVVRFLIFFSLNHFCQLEPAIVLGY